MRFWSFFFLLHLQCSALAVEHHVPSAAEDFGPNLPVYGSSLFDKIYSENINGKIVYKINFPLDRLLQQASQNDKDFWNHSLIPFGRSLQRPVDLRFDPLLNPRLILSATKGAANNKLFMGYVKATDQIEIISYNDEAGRFEFQVIQDYSRAPKVFYVDRGRCLSCHQGQGPIFSQGPWADNSLGLVGDLIGAKLGLEESLWTRNDLVFKNLFDSEGSFSNVSMVDAGVREANQLNFDERLWVWGCGESNECRLGLLMSTLVPRSSGAEPVIRRANLVLEASDLRNQKIYHSILSSTDLGIRDVVKRYSLEGRMDPAAVANSPKALLEIISNVYKIGELDNPATSRGRQIESSQLRSGRLSNFTLEDFEFLQETKLSSEALALALKRLYVSSPNLFSQRPINKANLLRELFLSLNSPLAKNYEPWVGRQGPEKVLLADPLPVFYQTKELNVLARHCSACHSASVSFPPQFMNGTEEKVLKQVRSLARRMESRILNQTMPPSLSQKNLFQESGDQQIVLDYLRSL